MGNMSLLALLNLLGAGQALLLSVALISVRRGDRAANRILAALVAVLAVFVLGAVSTSTRFYLFHPHVSFAHDPIILLGAPLLYLYVRALLEPGSTFERTHLWHLLPAIGMALYLAPWFVESAAQKYAYMSGTYEKQLVP